MGVGSGIALTALGAVLAFAVQDSIGTVDLTMVGYILMLAGVLVAGLSLMMANQKRSHSAQTITTDSAGRQEVAETRTETTPPVAP